MKIVSAKVLSKKKMGKNMMPGMPMMFNELDNVIHLVGEISEDNITEVVKKLQEIEEDNFEDIILDIGNRMVQIEKEVEPVKIYINTCGGSVHDGLALIAQIRNMKTPVHTYVLGKAFSMGLPIFMAGSKRFASPLASFMFHNMYTIVGGNPYNVKEYSNYYSELEKDVIETTFPKELELSEEVLAKFEKSNKENFDFWFSGKQAYEWGLATDIFNIDNINNHDDKECDCEDCNKEIIDIEEEAVV